MALIVVAEQSLAEHNLTEQNPTEQNPTEQIRAVQTLVPPRKARAGGTA